MHCNRTKFMRALLKMNFAKKRKKAQRIRRERALLLVYALAVTAALIISVYNNNSVKSSTPYDVEVEKILTDSVFCFKAKNLHAEIEQVAKSIKKQVPRDRASTAPST